MMPMDLDRSLPLGARALLSAKVIRERVCALAQEIEQAYEGREFVLLGVLKGSLHFVSDLLRSMKCDPRLEWVRVITYPEGTTARDKPSFLPVGDLNLEGKDVLVVDDILDRGHTSKAILEGLSSHHPNSIQWAFLLVKAGAPERTGLRPDFTGFEIPDVWVAGYGLDHSERFRNHDQIFVL
jgi:hypoxanthine phosphoribosyltransferase